MSVADEPEDGSENRLPSSSSSLCYSWLSTVVVRKAGSLRCWRTTRCAQHSFIENNVAVHCWAFFLSKQFIACIIGRWRVNLNQALYSRFCTEPRGSIIATSWPTKRLRRPTTDGTVVVVPGAYSVPRRQCHQLLDGANVSWAMRLR